MDFECDVAVIGAGPAGSYTAFLLAAAGHNVLLLEQRKPDDIAPLCTGVVGLPYVELVGVDRDVILAEARSATFLSPSGVRMHVSSTAVQACVLDRALLERRLRARAVAAGVGLREACLVSRVTRSGDVLSLLCRTNGGTERFTCHALVLAAGVSPGLARQLGIGVPARFLVGAHAEVEMDGVPETEVHFIPDLASGAFAWLVPVGGRRVRVGVLSGRAAAGVARRFLERPAVKKRLVSGPEIILQRPVPVSVPRRCHSLAVVAVGDAAGQVKPTTGGGLYFGAVAARAAAGALDAALKAGDLSPRSLGVYERAWRSALGSELRRGILARRIYDRLTPGQVDRILARASRAGMPDVLLGSPSFSFDRHSGTLLTGFLRCLPGILPIGGSPHPEAMR